MQRAPEGDAQVAGVFRTTSSTFTRRELLRAALGATGALTLLSACQAQAPRATSEAPAAAAPPQGWDALVQAARQEGRLVVYGPPGPTYRQVVVNSFERAYPDIRVEAIFAGGADNAQRLIAERTGGRNLADVLVSGPITPLTTLRPAGIIVPLKPLLVLPEVVDASKWQGEHHWWADDSGEYVLQFAGQVTTIASFNRDQVDPSQFRSYQDFLDPRWKGKIVATDVRRGGVGASAAQWIYKNPRLGPSFLDRLFGESEMRLSSDQRQMIDWLAQGQYPIGLFLSGTDVRRAQAQGLPVGVVSAEQFTDGAAVSAGFGSVSYIDQAPHPNAAKVFVNWLVSREGQEAWQRETETPSLRVDVPKDKLFDTPQPNVSYENLASEEYISLQQSVLQDVIDKALQRAGRS